MSLIPIADAGYGLMLLLVLMRYGMFYYGKRFRKRRDYAHRVAWGIYKGKIPEGMHVLHNCDNPACVNPDHLFLGTHADNMKDKGDKGRAPRFTRTNPPMTKLIPQDCFAIQKEYTGRYGEILVLADKYNVHRNTLTQALRYKE